MHSADYAVIHVGYLVGCACVVLFRAWFNDFDDVIIRHISRRVSDVTGLNTTQPAAEPLQVETLGSSHAVCLQ